MKEEFLINDITLSINPSDIIVLSDDFVYETSYMRSSAVFVKKSKYAKDKIILHIPFKISDIHDDTEQTHHTQNCVTLITQLDNYPFCFIKSKRLESYIAPSFISQTGYLMYAIDEITLKTSAEASDMLFLEIALLYYNYSPLIRDFRFLKSSKKTLKITDEETGEITNLLSPQDTLDETVISSLKDSIEYQKYFSKFIDRSLTKIKKFTENSKNSLKNYGLDVYMAAPFVMDVTNTSAGAPEADLERDLDEALYMDQDGVKLTVTNTAAYDNGAFEDLYKGGQNFSFTNPDGSEKFDPTETKQQSDARKKEEASSKYGDDNESFSTNGKKNLLIQWVGQSLSTFGLVVEGVEIKKKNKLATHQIGAYRHPIIQHMGKFPTSLSLRMKANSGTVYENSTASMSIVKQMINILNYNNTVYPEASSQNFLKISSIHTALLNTDSFVPGQHEVIASSDEQGVETILLTMHEANISEFLRLTKTKGSGKKSTNKVDKIVNDSIILFIKEFNSQIKNNLKGVSSTDLPRKLDIYSEILNISRIMAREFGDTEDSLLTRNIDLVSNNLSLLSSAGTVWRLPVNKETKNNQIYYKEFKTADLNTSGIVDIFPKFATSFENLSIASTLLSPATAAINTGANIGDIAINTRLAAEQSSKDFSNVVHVPIANVILELNDKIVSLLSTRNEIIVTGGTDKKNVSWTGKSPQLTSLFDSLMTKLTLYSDINEDISKKIISKFGNSYLREYGRIYGSLYGQAIPDYNLDVLVDNYEDETDVLVQSMDPFFFLEEIPHIETATLDTIYQTLSQEFVQNFTKGVEQNVSDPKSEDTKSPDGSQLKRLPFEINPLTEQDYNYQPLEVVNIQSAPLSFDGSFNIHKDNTDPTRISGSIFQPYGLNMSTKGLTAIQTSKLEAAKAAIESGFAESSFKTLPLFRQYMYAAAFIESSMNTNPTSYERGGLFQILTPAIADLNKKSEKTGITYTVDSVKNRETNNVSAFLGFTEILIGYMRKYNVPLTYANLYLTHQQGAKGLAQVLSAITSNGVLERSLRLNMQQNVAKLVTANQSKMSDKEYAILFYKTMALRLLKDPSKDIIINTGEPFSLFQNTISNQNPEINTQPLVNPVSKLALLQAEEATTKPLALNMVDTAFGSAGLKYKVIVSGIRDGDTADVKFLEVLSGTLTKTNTLLDKKLIHKGIRFYGIDTPETDHTRLDKETGKYVVYEGNEKYGELAKKRLCELMGIKYEVMSSNTEGRQNVSGRVLSLELLNTAAVGRESQRKDNQDRLVGIFRTADGFEINAQLIKEGLAFATPGFTSDHKYLRLENEARLKKLGIWSQDVQDIKKPRGKKFDNRLNFVENNDLINRPVTFTAADLAQAGNRGYIGNDFQPFEKNQKFKISSAFSFGANRTVRGKTRPHAGVDFSTPPGTGIIAAADGVISRCGDNGNGSDGTGGGGLFIVIDHGNGFISKYLHLSKIGVTLKSNVKAGQLIGYTGNTGHSTGPHLHYEVQFRGKPINPFGTKPLNSYSGMKTDSNFESAGIDTRSEVNFENDSFVKSSNSSSIFDEDKLATALLKYMKEGLSPGLKTSVPTVKAYITIGNENDDFILGAGANTQYYELNGIRNLHLITNNDENPLDVLTMEVANPSFSNTDSYGVATTRSLQPNISQIGTDFETQFKNDRLKIKPGMKLHIRAGYSNNINDLSVIFNGYILEASEGNIYELSLICESYSKELLNYTLAPEKPLKMGGFINASSGHIIGQVLGTPSIYNFGKRYTKIRSLLKTEWGDNSDPENKQLIGVINRDNAFFFKIFGDNSILKSAVFMNVYSAAVEKAQSQFLFKFSSLADFFAPMRNTTIFNQFIIHRATPWSVLKQMEYRHPNTIMKPMFYEDRHTLFYGIKEQFYIHKPANTILSGLAGGSIDALDSSVEKVSAKAYDNIRDQRMKPAVGFHCISSNTNLISNGISLNKSYATTVDVSFYDDVADFKDTYAWDSFQMTLDDNLNPWEIRAKEIRFNSTKGKYSSFVYGTTALKKECEKMYGGKIFILGNPEMKSGDYAFIEDFERKQLGVILIRECIHHIDENRGFITEITPGQYVEAANFMNSMLWAKLALTAKVASAVVRVNDAQKFQGEDFRNVTDYLHVLDQYMKATDQKVDSEAVFEGVAGFGLTALLGGLALHYSKRDNKVLLNKMPLLGKILNKLPGNHLATFYASSLKGSLSYMKYMTKDSMIRQIITGVAGSYYNDFSNKYFPKFVGPPTPEKAARSKKILLMKTAVADRIKNMNAVRKASIIGKGSWLLKGAIYTSRLSGRLSIVATKAVLSTLISTVKALALSNPIGLIIDVVVQFIASWAFAKTEEISLTRQPIMFFPLVQHGKPYIGGMSGSVRNDYLSSLKLNWAKNKAIIERSAAIVYTNRTIQGNPNSILNSLLHVVGEDVLKTAINPVNVSRNIKPVKGEVKNDK